MTIISPPASKMGKILILPLLFTMMVTKLGSIMKRSSSFQADQIRGKMPPSEIPVRLNTAKIEQTSVNGNLEC